jgi:hypothetical protein
MSESRSHHAKEPRKARLIMGFPSQDGKKLEHVFMENGERDPVRLPDLKRIPAKVEVPPELAIENLLA